MVAPAFATRFPDGWSQYTDGDTSSLQSATPAAVTGISGFVSGTAMAISLAANNVSTPGGTATADPTHQRCEVDPAVAGLGCVSSDGDIHDGASGYFGLAIKLDPAFPTTTTTWQLCTQWKNDGDGTPPLELKIGVPSSIGGSTGYLYLDGNSGGWQQPICPVQPGGVYTIVLGFTFTTSASTSYMSAWVNGTRYLTNAQPGSGLLYAVSPPAVAGSYWKVGLYRDAPNIPQAATIWYGALAHDLAYQPVADYIAATTSGVAPTTTTDTATGAEQANPPDTTGIGRVYAATPHGAEQGSPAETALAGQGWTSTPHGAEQGSPGETTAGAAISNTPVTSVDAPFGDEDSPQAEVVFSGTQLSSGELPTVVVPPAAQGSPGAPPVSGPQHFAMPFRLLASGSYAALAQDSPDDVVGCVSALLRTRIGELIEVPGFGVPDPTFMAPTGHWATVLESAVSRWEPRAAGAAIPVQINEDGTATVMVGVPTRPGGPAT